MSSAVNLNVVCGKFKILKLDFNCRLSEPDSIKLHQIQKCKFFVNFWRRGRWKLCRFGGYHVSTRISLPFLKFEKSEFDILEMLNKFSICYIVISFYFTVIKSLQSFGIFKLKKTWYSSLIMAFFYVILMDYWSS